MSEASNDKRKCDIFTKGSHHRNLSVIKIILPGERKLYHKPEQSVFSVIQQPTGQAINHGASKTDVPRVKSFTEWLPPSLLAIF